MLHIDYIEMYVSGSHINIFVEILDSCYAWYKECQMFLYDV